MAVGAKVKGITIQFDGDTTKLGNALKDIDKKSRAVDRSLKQVNNALKFNPKNTELIAQKQTLLKQKIDQTKDRLQILEQTQKKLDDDPSIDKTSQEYMELRREIITTESKLKHFTAEQRKLDRIKFTNLGKSFASVGGKIKSVGRTMTMTASLIGATAVYAGKKLIEMSQQQAQAEQKLAEIYKTRMGVGEKAVQSTLKLTAAEQKLGVVGDEVQLAAAQQLATYSKTPNTVNTMIPALNNLLVQQKGLNATQEDAVGLANLFGKAMMGQTGALKRAGISFTEAQEKILKTGTEEEKAAMIAEVVTQNVGHMNAEFAKTDAGKIQQAKNAIGDMGEELGAILLPAVADAVHWIQDNLLPKIKEFIEWMKQHPEVAKFALAISGIALALGPVLMLIGNITTAIGGLIRFIPMLLSPIGLVVAAIAAVIAIGVLIYKNWEKIKAFLLKTWEAIKAAVVAVGQAIANAFKSAWEAIKAAWSVVVSWFTNIWNAIKKVFSFVVGFYRTIFTAAFNAVKFVWGKIVGFFKTVWAGIKGVFNAVVGFFRGVFSRAWTAIKNVFKGVASFFGGIWDKIKSKFSKLGTAIGGAISGAVAAGINGIISFIEKAINGAIHLINGAIKLINKIPGVEIGKIKDIKLPRVNWNAEGGIFDHPTVLQGVGEAGAEAVIPLNKFWRKMDAIAANASGTENITVNVYGSDNMNVDELALAVQRKIIQLQKRRTMAWQ